jgi:hypothetical protein
MSAARDTLERPSDEAAMARVLAAESEARDALERSTRQAARMLEEARAAAKAIAAAAARRAGAVRTSMERRLATRLAQIEALEREALAAGPLLPGEHDRLARAVERLATDLTRGEP